jgi:hypothetical protein
MTEATQAISAPQESQKDQEVNFQKIRKQLEQERSEKQQMQQRLAELEKSHSQKQQAQFSSDDDDESGEPYVDHKRLEKKFKKFESSLDEKIDQKAEQKARMMIEQDRQQNYVKTNPDFQDTLTQENIQKFAEKHPAIAERMLRMPDNFDRQALLYEQIKALQVNKKEEPKPSVQQTIDANRRSPFYQPTGVGTSPYAQTGDFSPAGQKNAYAKLQELKSRLKI